MIKRTYNGGMVINFRAAHPTTEHKVKNGTHTTQAERLSIDFCTNHCPNKSCNGDRCKQLKQFLKEKLK